MIVDTSAVMAILREEPDTLTIVETMTLAQHLSMSAGSWLELAAVITRTANDGVWKQADRLIERFAITIEPVSLEQAEIARGAYRRFGRGTGHPAGLNFGDCFAYALARATGEPLLFKGGDFSHTDVARA